MILDNGTVKISASSFKNLANIWSIPAGLLISNTAFKYVGNKMPRRFQNFSVCLSNTSAKICCRLNRNLCILHRQWLRHTSAFCPELWSSFLTVETTCSTWIIMFTYNTLELVKRKTMLPLLITLFWFLRVSL